MTLGYLIQHHSLKILDDCVDYLALTKPLLVLGTRGKLEYSPIRIRLLMTVQEGDVGGVISEIGVTTDAGKLAANNVTIFRCEGALVVIEVVKHLDFRVDARLESSGLFPVKSIAKTLLDVHLWLHMRQVGQICLVAVISRWK